MLPSSPVCLGEVFLCVVCSVVNAEAHFECCGIGLWDSFSQDYSATSRVYFKFHHSNSPNFFSQSRSFTLTISPCSSIFFPPILKLTSWDFSLHLSILSLARTKFNSGGVYALRFLNSYLLFIVDLGLFLLPVPCVQTNCSEHFDKPPLLIDVSYLSCPSLSYHTTRNALFHLHPNIEHHLSSIYSHHTRSRPFHHSTHALCGP